MLNKNLLFLAPLLSLAIFIVFNYSADINTTLIVTYPSKNLNTTNLTIRGNSCGLNWNKGLALQKTANNTWTISLTCPASTNIEVKAMINDSVWMVGGNYKFSLKNQAGIQQFTIWPSFNPTINDILNTTAIKSAILNNSRICSIYYPPSYYENTYKKYPVLIMHDGQNLFYDATSAFGAWKIQNTLNSLVYQGSINQIIVVGIWNTNNRNNQYTYSYDPSEKFGGKGDLYLNFIELEALPVLKKTLAGRMLNQKFDIGGSSLGGLISCYAAYTRPQIYNKAICMSSSFWWNSEDFTNKILVNKFQDVMLYLDSGNAGPSSDSVNQTIRARDKLKAIGYTLNTNLFYYLDQGGQHSEAYWGKRFEIPLKYLYGA